MYNAPYLLIHLKRDLEKLTPQTIYLLVENCLCTFCGTAEAKHHLQITFTMSIHLSVYQFIMGNIWKWSKTIMAMLIDCVLSCIANI